MIDFPLVFIGFWRASPSKMLVLLMVFDREVVDFSLVFVGFSEGHQVGSRYRPQVSDDEVGGRGSPLVRRRKVALAAGIRSIQRPETLLQALA